MCLSQESNYILVLCLLTLLSIGVGLDLQHHCSNGVSVHVVERVGDPLKQEHQTFRYRMGRKHWCTGGQFVSLTSSRTIPASCTRVMFLKILMVIFSAPSTCSTSPKNKQHVTKQTLLAFLKSDLVCFHMWSWICFISDLSEQPDQDSREKCSVWHGVPQGSAPGPLLFLVYVKDSTNECSRVSLRLNYQQ